MDNEGSEQSAHPQLMLWPYNAVVKIPCLANKSHESQREREGETEISQVNVDKTLRYLGQRYCDVVNFNQSFQRHSAKQSLLHLIAKLSLLGLIFLNSTRLTHQMC